MTQTIAPLVARVLLAVLFIMAGIGKLGNVEGFAGFMESGGVPGFLAWPVIAFEILGGVALLVGFQTRLVALALGAFCLASGVLYHFVPADQMQMTMFMKNLALTGGYIALALTGAGAWSVDAWTGSSARAATA
ncbi:DoxX family protein [Primorskyibacter aestuariivivens]|uniref:DoxX family protein n=1 Tax=Primorskyibacter aestuariivivens TaxID=1888912 RepID=UPI002300A9FA|nr:DoxX family protein [Primorskyibacter aestuariivivens]MDA7430316.1 DoxX family protein [Primorskyibacter aestuariivivens]